MQPREPLYGRRSLRDRLDVSPGDYDTNSPRFGNFSPRYSIKTKYPAKELVDNKDFPDHLEPNDMARSPAYTIGKKRDERIDGGAGYEFFPKFGQESLKKSIGIKIPPKPRESYGSPDNFDTREKLGDATPRYSIGERLQPSWLLSTVDSPGPKYLDSNSDQLKFSATPKYTINDNKIEKRSMANTPGPGHYTVLPDFSTVRPRMTIGEKLKDEKKPQVPGPDVHALQEPWAAPVPTKASQQTRLNEKPEKTAATTRVSFGSSKMKAKGLAFTIGEKFSEGKIDQEGLDYIDPPSEMGQGSPRTRIRERPAGQECAWIPKSITPGPSAYQPEKIALPSQKFSIKPKFQERKIKEPITEYIALPELPRGRKCVIGNRETMELVR